MIDCIIVDLNSLQRITIDCIKDLVFILSPFDLCSESWIMIDCIIVDLDILHSLGTLSIQGNFTFTSVQMPATYWSRRTCLPDHLGRCSGN